ncbi:MAG: JAB domain-containing protein [Candidatus Scalindua sp.]|nr:JAB domain-containing protein [Candidatus Scalindua sp.]
MNIRLNKNQKVKVNSSKDIYTIMKQILLRENKYGITKEHFWVVGIGFDNRILYIELISLGSTSLAVVNPNEVLRLAVQKNAPKIILVHNHPSETLTPSEEDKDLTDRLIQAARIVSTEVIDHLIITPKKYFSFADSLLFAELVESKKYVLYYELEDKAMQKGKEQGVSEGLKKGKKEGAKKKAIEIAKKMLSEGVNKNNIVDFTGLSKMQITKLAITKPNKKNT